MGTIRTALTQYGEIQYIQEEKWFKACGYAVANCVRIMVITLTKHIASHLTIAGHRVLASYDVQPMTCYGCGDTGYIYQACTRRRREKRTAENETTATWADIAREGKNHRGQ